MNDRFRRLPAGEGAAALARSGTTGGAMTGGVVLKQGPAAGVTITTGRLPPSAGTIQALAVIAADSVLCRRITGGVGSRILGGSRNLPNGEYQ